jgi:hypothetical protein
MPIYKLVYLYVSSDSQYKVIIFLNSLNQFIFLLVKRYVFFDVQTNSYFFFRHVKIKPWRMRLCKPCN